MKQLILNGQLEIVNGGWSMHDEACPTYTEMIENMVKGHAFILQELGEEIASNIKIGWQLDDFGHSNSNAKLLAQMGYEALFFARIHYQDHRMRAANQELEFIWQPDGQSVDGHPNANNDGS